MDNQYGPGTTVGFPHLDKKVAAKVAAATQRKAPDFYNAPDVAFRKASEGRLIGLRVNRYGWWVHWRELADYILPRRYKWLITPNQMSRGSPINQHILDPTGSLAARDLAAGMMMGCSDPTKKWFRYKINNIDSSMPGPTAIWLSKCEKIISWILAKSNFYDAMAIFYFDLVVFGTASLLVYEDFAEVINCINPCLGEYYVDVDGNYRPYIFAREFTFTVEEAANMFGVENLSPSTAALWAQGGTSLTRELVVAHFVEPNKDGRKYGIDSRFAYRECYWEWGGSASPQGGSSYSPGLLRKRGFYESPAIIGRWDLVSNDAYGRSPGMDALPDIKQLQLETKRLSQGIDKMVNPPMVGDVQLKNQPASLLPGGITYVTGVVAHGRPGFAPAYLVNPQVREMMEQLAQVQERIRQTFYKNLFQTISQFTTRSNVTATEIDARRAEAMLMLGPVLERLNHEVFAKVHDRVFGIASRADLLPQAPAEIRGANISVEFTSMIELAQMANKANSIQELMTLASQFAAVDPQMIDNVDMDKAFDKVANLKVGEPELIRSPAQLKQIRDARAQQQAQAQQAQQAENASKLAAGAKNLSQTPMPGGGSALGALVGGGGLGGG